MKLWLDDFREPWLYTGEVDWVWAKTVEEAKTHLATGNVEVASLDHDLGACSACEDAFGSNWAGMTPHCEHVGTGYTLVCWMEETGHWPKEKPKVHSMNPAGRAKMELAINREWAKRSAI
jgi:hypothetical protein